MAIRQHKLTIKDIFTLTLLLTTITMILAKKADENQGITKVLETVSSITSSPTYVTLLAITAVALTIHSLRKTVLSGEKILLGLSGLVPFYIDLSTPRHIVIFGMTGSGKTETAKRIALKSKKKKLIIDWAGEYNYGLTATPSQLSLNLKPHEIVDSITSAFHLTIPQQSMLFEASKEANSLTSIIERIKKIKVTSETQREIRDAILRRLLPLENLKLFCGKMKLSDIDTLDLSSLTYEAKKLAVNIVLRMFYNSPEPRLLVIEEAQNIIPRQPTGNLPTSAELIINELRKRGVSVILVAQTPSQISLAYRNADYIILHRLQLTTSEAQLLGVSKAEAERLARLETGNCLVIERGKKKWIKVLRKQAQKPSSTKEKEREEPEIKATHTSR
ncbi:MAG: hypothetical protein DRJ20_01870, partial [Candidatus Methanomethylicota archaeon]